MRKSAAEIAGAMMEGQMPDTEEAAAPAPDPIESTASPKKSQSKYPEFSTPSSFQPPQGVTPDEDFKAVGTFRMKGDGTMCLVAVDGSPVSRG